MGGIILIYAPHFPESGRSIRPGNDYSEDDDDNSIEIKDQEVELVKLKNARYYEQMSGDDDNPGEDCPFWSNLIWPNCQLLNFGLARICILIIFTRLQEGSAFFGVI